MCGIHWISWKSETICQLYSISMQCTIRLTGFDFDYKNWHSIIPNSKVEVSEKFQKFHRCIVILYCTSLFQCFSVSCIIQHWAAIRNKPFHCIREYTCSVMHGWNCFLATTGSEKVSNYNCDKLINMYTKSLTVTTQKQNRIKKTSNQQVNQRWWAWQIIHTQLDRKALGRNSADRDLL